MTYFIKCSHGPGPGRPASAFESLSASQKRRRVNKLVETTSTAELALACEVEARKDNLEASAAKLVNAFFENNIDATVIRNAYLLT